MQLYSRVLDEARELVQMTKRWIIGVDTNAAVQLLLPADRDVLPGPMPSAGAAKRSRVLAAWLAEMKTSFPK